MAYNPKASSTPKTITGRPSIRSSEMIQSPIENSEENSKSEASSDSDNRPSPEKKSEQRNTSEQNESTRTHFYINYNLLYTVLMFAIPVGILYFYDSDVQSAPPSLPFEKLQKEFPTQEEDFWINVKVAVEDISKSSQPKSIIFLYKDETTMFNILKGISNYASSQICDSSEPIVVPGSYLNKREIVEDYGAFIAEIKEKLNNKCVVVIPSLDQVPGTSAQAFHSLCDEYNPLKKNILIMFTIKVDSFPENSSTFVEKKLRELWSDLHNDKFYPLYTRMSTFILRVRSGN